jgi:hypothetical protein
MTLTEPTSGGPYQDQLAARVAELLPDLASAERLGLLGAMEPGEMSAALAFAAGIYPQVFDFALVRDRKLVERLPERIDDGEDVEDDLEPYCATCGAGIGIFHGHGDAWLHYTGQGTAASPVDLYDAGHEPVAAWRPAGER